MSPGFLVRIAKVLQHLSLSLLRCEDDRFFYLNCGIRELNHRQARMVPQLYLIPTFPKGNRADAVS